MRGPRVPVLGDARDEEGSPIVTPLSPALIGSFDRSYATVRSLTFAPPLAVELVRLRNAAVQGCQYCMSRRFGPAVPDEAQVAVALRGDGAVDGALGEDERLLLRLADAFVGDPASMPEDLRTELAAHFSPEVVVEVVLRLAHYTVNRVKVALRLDIEPPATTG